jgi:hypothetical protein
VNVLIVSTVEHAEDVLRSQLAGAEKIKIVVPVVRQGVLDWLANDQKAFSHAETVAEETAAELPGETVEAVAGEADVELAIRDALATFAADEIVVAVHPHAERGAIERLAAAGAPRESFDGIPIRFLVVSEED